jgi:hypothetical protein
MALKLTYLLGDSGVCRGGGLYASAAIYLRKIFTNNLKHLQPSQSSTELEDPQRNLAGAPKKY